MTDTMSSRALPIAVLGLSMVFFWVLVAAAVGGGNLTDPAEILTRGAQATAGADSFSMALSVEGSMADPATGMDVSLDGATVEGDVDIADDSAQFSFTLPGLLGMSGEVIVIGPDTYVMSAMVGDSWIHLPPNEAAETGSEPPTDEEIANKVNELLTTDGIGIALLADQPCGDDTCYHVQVSIAAEAFAAHGADMSHLEVFGMGTESPLPNPQFTGPAVVDLLFQQEGLWLRQVSVASAEDEATRLTLALDDYNASFDISAPPPDQVTEGEDVPFFPN